MAFYRAFFIKNWHVGDIYTAHLITRYVNEDVCDGQQNQASSGLKSSSYASGCWVPYDCLQTWEDHASPLI